MKCTAGAARKSVFSAFFRQARLVGGGRGGPGDCKGEGEQPAAKTATRECRKLQQAIPHEHQPQPPPALQQQEASVTHAQQALERLNFNFNFNTPPSLGGGGLAGAVNETKPLFGSIQTRGQWALGRGRCLCCQCLSFTCCLHACITQLLLVLPLT